MVGDLFTYMGAQRPLGQHSVRSYVVVSGTDTYYELSGNVVRLRTDGSNRTSVLTVKVRKSKDSIADRHEVDLPLDPSVRSYDAIAFLELGGWKRLFSIEKTSFIWHLEPNLLGGGDHGVCIALYDVYDTNQPEHDGGTDRFLEIEIEKNSRCTHERSVEALAGWVKELQAALQLGEPLNQSLLEMYRPKPDPTACIGCRGLVHQDRCPQWVLPF